MNLLKTVRHRSYTFSAIAIVLGLAIPAQTQQPPGPPTPADPQLKSSDPLSPLNAAFRTAYAGFRSRIIQETSPIIVHFGDKMALIKNGVRTEAPSFTPRYHELKAVAHVPLALHVMLVSGAGSKLDDSQLNNLRQYRALVAKARDSIEGRGYGPKQRDRQLRMLDNSLALVDSTLQTGLVTKGELRRFAQHQSKDILANVHEAAEDQIETMDRQVKTWLAVMTPEERKRLHVAVGSAHMPRVGNLAMQYFSVALNELFKGRFEEEEIQNSDFRLVFTESLFDENEILKVLATHILDADIGSYFFDDRQRMHRDLLADAAEQILREKFGQTRSARRQTPDRTGSR